jgi:hypothetical protein
MKGSCKLFLGVLGLLLSTTGVFAQAQPFGCHTKIVGDGEVVGEKLFVGSAVGKEGWDGIGGQCRLPGSDRIWVGPRNADGTCLTAASLVGTQGGFAVKDTLVVTGTETYEHRYFVPVPSHLGIVYVGSGWKPGPCP